MGNSSTKRKKILVTGATGFTGGALAKKLTEDGHHVIALVRKTGNISKLKDLGVDLVFGDISNQADVLKAAKGVDIIYHIAAVYRTAGHSDEYYEAVNVQGVKNIIAAAKKHNVKRTVHCSTVGVHGNISEIPSDENSPFNPGDIYQRTKLKGEMLFAEAMQNGLKGAIFRPGAIYGPGDTRLLKMFKSINRGFFPLFGGGGTLYHLSYIDDLVDGIILCGEHPKALGETFILCSNEYSSIQELGKVIAESLDVRPPTLKLPITPLLIAAKICEAICKPFGINPPLHTRRCEFFIKSRAFSNKKAKQLIGFNPKVTTREGVNRTSEWYKQHGYL